MSTPFNDFGYPEELLFTLEEPPKQYGKRKSNNDFAAELRARFKRAAIMVVNFFERQPTSPAISVIRYQILNSATSSAANYRAVCRARSNKEFYAKYCIVVEETDETPFWLEMLKDSDIKVDNEEVSIIGKDWQELLMIVAKARSNAKP